MKTLIREMIGLAMSCGDGTQMIAVLPQIEAIKDLDPETNRRIGSFSIPDGLFPSDFQICRVPGDETILQSLEEQLPNDHPIRVFVFAPLIHRRYLSDTLRAQFPSMDLAGIVLSSVAKVVAPGSLIGVLQHANLLFTESSRAIREYLREFAVPRVLVEHDHSTDVFGFEVHSQFRMVMAFLKKGGRADEPVRFFKCPSVDNDTERQEVLDDFRRLIQQEGGKTRHGFVLRGGLPPDAMWLFDFHHPDMAKRKADLAHLGGLKTLGDLVEVKRGIHPQMDRNLLIDPSAPQGVAVIEGRDIKADGAIECEDPRYRALIPETQQVQPGDICVRAIQGNQSRLVCAVVAEEMEAATASHSVIVLRPRTGLTGLDREFLLAYLQSSSCVDFLKARGLGINIVPRKLLELPVPVADDALHLAVESLGHAARQFRAWAEELEAVRGSLFDSKSARNARVNALSAGRLARQRYEAATLVGDFKQRVRTRFPFPVAFRWRAVESQLPTLEGYIQVLECAEVAVTYLAIMALLLSRSVQKPIRRLGEMAKRITSTGHGTNMGDWISILQEAGGADFAEGIPDTAPFVEVSRFQNDPAVTASLKLLAAWRNDQAHGRGPKGGEVTVAFENAKRELATLLQHVEFITDYPLRHIEATRRDTLQRITRYEYRELMGDHALVPLSKGETPDPETEANSLYFCDRAGHLHLLRPFLTGRECPVCHSWGTFFLDSYRQGCATVTLKSMEHGHTWEDSSLVPAFHQTGMIE